MTPFLVEMRRFEAANGGRPFPPQEERRLLRVLAPIQRPLSPQLSAELRRRSQRRVSK